MAPNKDAKKSKEEPKQVMKDLFQKGLFRHLKWNYPFLKSLNYATKVPSVGWRHADFPGIKLIFCTDFELCKKSNELSNPDQVAFAYYNQDVINEIDKKWDNQRILDVTVAIESWEPFKYVNPDLKRWCMDIGARISAGLTQISLEQNIIGAKWFLSTFLTDDPLEKAMEKEEWWSTGEKFLEKFYTIYDGSPSKVNEPQITMAGDEGTAPQKIIDGMNLALRIHQKELEPTLRRVMSPIGFKFGCDWAMDYARNIAEESKAFAPGLRKKEFVDIYANGTTRIWTIGYFWIVPPLVANPEEFYSVITSGQDPLTVKLAWVCAQDNDIASGPKDVKVDGRDFSPVSKVNWLIQEAEKKGEKLSFLNALRTAIQFSNNCKKEIEEEIATMGPNEAQHYMWQYHLLHKLFDYHFVASIDRPNYRYGWEPFLL